MPTPSNYRIVTLINREPPANILRHAQMIPGETGRYAKVVRYQHDAGKTIYEVLHFKTGRAPTREEVLADLRDDLKKLGEALDELRTTGRLSSWIDSKLFSGTSAADLEKKREDIQETIEAVEENYEPGESVEVP